MITAIIAAHQGFLNICLLVILAIIATILSDVLYFNLGKHKANQWISKCKYANKFNIVKERLEKNKTKMLIGYRFIYGMRVITPLVLGSQDLAFFKFLEYSFVSTIIWCIVIVGIGYFFGEFVVNGMKNV